MVAKYRVMYILTTVLSRFIYKLIRVAGTTRVRIKFPSYTVRNSSHFLTFTVRNSSHFLLYSTLVETV